MTSNDGEKMPNISGLGSFAWPAKYSNLTADFEMFWVTMKCPKCGREWKFASTRNKLADSKWQILIHREKCKLVWTEGWAKTLCLKCGGKAIFHFGVHLGGNVVVGPYNETFDERWWIDPVERQSW